MSRTANCGAHRAHGELPAPLLSSLAPEDVAWMEGKQEGGENLERRPAAITQAAPGPDDDTTNHPLLDTLICGPGHACWQCRGSLHRPASWITSVQLRFTAAKNKTKAKTGEAGGKQRARGRPGWQGVPGAESRAAPPPWPRAAPRAAGPRGRSPQGKKRKRRREEQNLTKEKQQQKKRHHTGRRRR